MPERATGVKGKDLFPLDSGGDLRHSISMPSISMPQGALAMLILRVLQTGPSHGYAIAQHIHQLSGQVLAVEEGSLYPALQRMLMEGWVTAEWGVSDTKRRVRFYTITDDGLKQLHSEVQDYRQATLAIQGILGEA